MKGSKVCINRRQEIKTFNICRDVVYDIIQRIKKLTEKSHIACAVKANMAEAKDTCYLRDIVTLVPIVV